MTDSILPPDNGKRAPIARVGEAPKLGEVGTGDGYSGQEYDSKDQARWRADQEALQRDGEVRGSGAGAGGGNPGEELDSDSANGDGSVPGGTSR